MGISVEYELKPGHAKHDHGLNLSIGYRIGENGIGDYSNV